MSKHLPVMVQECLEYFSEIEIETFFDGTLGAGGHARAILQAHPEIKRYIGCDQDPGALKIAKENLKPWAKKLSLVNGNFADVAKHLAHLGMATVDGFFLTWECHRCNSTRGKKVLVSPKKVL